MKNQIYNIEIEILSPVHIWNWETISWIDYFCYQEQLRTWEEKHNWWKFNQVYESYLYKYKLEDLIDILDEKDKQDLLKIIKDWDIIEFRKKIWYLLKDVETEEYKQWLEKELQKEKKNKWYKKWEYKNIRYKWWKYKEKYIKIAEEPIKITNKFFSDFVKKITLKWQQINSKKENKQENEKKNQISQLLIQEFINQKWKYYIPWSSLKWAIRTTLTNEKIENSKPENDPFKKMIVRDSEWKSKCIEIWPLARKSKKSKDNDWEIKWDWTYAEFLKPWEVFKSQIIIKEFLDESNLEKIDFSKENICRKINDYTKTKIKSYILELDKFIRELETKDKWNKEKIQKIKTTKKSFQRILGQIDVKSQNTCILNIWFGWWFWFKSFKWAKNKIVWKDYYDEKWIKLDIPKTIYNTKLSNTDLENLGFIKLTFKD